MATSQCFTALCSIKLPAKQVSGLTVVNSTAGKVVWINHTTHNLRNLKLHSFEAKATDNNQTTKTTKTNSIVCADCEGNGAVQCSQCKGTGVNTEDHFNGRFKAGGLCWLCRGKKDILCGNCNGAGFLGGFMSTQDS